ncbi:MAG: DUF4145 domain-containing protein [Eubacteriales bacterium]|nr:DUF4145 domain-containing protein [Eubacteriales bacterium]
MGTNGNTNWEQIQQGVSETERLIRQKDYNGSMIKARQTLEFMVRLLCEQSRIPEGGDLMTMIDTLYDNRRISRSACEHYHKIRIIGNKAAHEGDANAYNANQAYHMLSQEVYAFAGDSRTPRTDFRPRRSESGQSPAARTAQAARAAAASGPRLSTGSADASMGGGRSARTIGSSTPASRSGTGSARGSQPSHSGVSRPHASAAGRSMSINRSRRRQPQRRRGFTMYDLLKLLIPVLCIVLLFLAVKLLKPASDNTETTPAQTTEAPTEPPTEPVTQAPEETEAPAPVYKTTSVLNVRPQPATDGDRIGQLDAGVTVEYVRAHDDQWAVIMYNGQEAYVASQYLTTE